MIPESKELEPTFRVLDDAVSELKQTKDLWAHTSVEEKILILKEIREATRTVAEAWAETAARKKLISPNSPLNGEEWFTGPAAMYSGVSGFIETLENLQDKRFLDKLPKSQLSSGQLKVRAYPASLWDGLVLPGVTADVWMQDGVTPDNLKENAASVYDIPVEQRVGKISLVLGAGNINSIPPLDCFQKLFIENQVVILKMNPINDYLADSLQIALKPLLEFGALRIVKGGADIGDFLCNHPDIDEIHITGSQAVHDIIVWGPGDEGLENKRRKTPKNKRRMTSELGAVCPTIVVPGPWSKNDIKFQAEQIASQKLHNSGFNCVACQTLIISGIWDKRDELLEALEHVIETSPSRIPYYPGVKGRLDMFEEQAELTRRVERSDHNVCLISKGEHKWSEHSEVFGPAMNVHGVEHVDPVDFLAQAIKYANENLHGTLGANIIIHPNTIKKIGKDKFEEMIADLKYGCIAINSWTGVGFLLSQTPWGAFPGHTLDDVQSGIGFVHNTFMFDRPERTVIWAPFRPMPKPVWFITNKKQHRLGKLFSDFAYRPSVWKFLRVLGTALRG